MLYGIYASGLGAIGQSIKLDTIANNLANINTPGFRRDHVTFRERLAEASQSAPQFKYYNSLVHRYGGAPFIDHTSFDQNSGTVEQTGRALDFAILGAGYFQVRDMGSGRLFYTRAGNFVLNSEGRLVTPDGKYEVMTDEERAMKLDPTSPDTQIRLDPDGTLYQGAEALGRFMIRDFADPNLVSKHGDNLFRADEENVGQAQGYRVANAALEGSSVNAVVEMVEMIKAIRAIESNLEMVRIQDGTLDKAVNDFGRVPR